MGSDIYHNWPVTLLWSWDRRCWSWFTWHAVVESAPHAYWVFHLGPLKVVFGKRTALAFREHFHKGLRTGLSYDPFTTAWMRARFEEGMDNER